MVIVVASDEISGKGGLEVNHSDRVSGHLEDMITGIDDEKVERLIIKFKSSDDHNLSAFDTIKEIPGRNLVTVKGSIKHISQLLDDPNVEFIEIDQNASLLGDSLGYGVVLTKAPFVWNQSMGLGVKVAVLDSGIGVHDDLSISGGYSAVSDDYFDSYGHGTMVAGVVGSLFDDEGIVGVSPSVELYAVKITNSSKGFISDAIQGLEWAIDNHMDVVVMSFGFPEYSQLFKEAVQDAYAEGIVLVAAAGNDDNAEILYPAKYTDVISVGAVDEYFQRWPQSNHGVDLELVAAGVDVNTTVLGDGYALGTGTSLAAPHVAGIAALLKSYNNSLSNEEIRAKLRSDTRDLGEPGRDDYFGYGLAQVNLSFGSMIINDSYFYEVFNVTGYGTEEQGEIFWLNGTGTIDDVEFAPGVFKVVKYLDPIEEKIIVVEEGGEFQLLVSANLEDDFNKEGSTFFDNIVWYNGSMKMYLSGDIEYVDAICVNIYKLDNQYDYCIYKTGKKTSCDTYSSGSSNYDRISFHDVCANYPQNCTEGDVLQFLNMRTNKTGRISDEVTAFLNCESSPNYDNEPIDFDVINTKKARCTSSTTYDTEGYKNAPSWLIISSYSCTQGRLCSSSLDEINITDPNSPVANPCGCNGTIEVNTVDNNEDPIGDLSVYLNGIFQDSVDEIGQVRIDFGSVQCNSNQEVTVKCANQSKTCGTKSTQIDMNNDYDSLNFDCTLCKEDAPDIWIDNTHIYLDMESNTVKVGVFSTSISGSTSVRLQRVDDDGILQPELNEEVTLVPGGVMNVTFSLLSIEKGDYLHISLDPDNDIEQEDNTNNYLFRPALKPINVYITMDIDSSFSAAQPVIEEFIGSFVNMVDTEGEADVIVEIRESFSLTDGAHTIFSDGKVVVNPYGAEVFKTSSGSKPLVTVTGNRIEGIIAGVKRMINARNIFLNKDMYFSDSIIDDYDRLGISVFDVMHNEEHQPVFSANNTQFAEVVRKVLFDNNFEVSIKPVKTLNTTSYNKSTILRVKHVNSDFSQDYKDAIGINDTPVVMAGGLFSDLFTFNSFGKELAAKGYDVWLIELTGGPYTDLETNDGCGSQCPNYTYDDLVDFYWPALVAGVIEYSDKQKINYLGHSNGGRVALSSLNSYSQSGKNNAGYYFDYGTGNYVYSDLPAYPVDKFFGIGVPASLNDETPFTEAVRYEVNYSYPPGQKTGNIAISRIDSNGLSHIRKYDYAKTLATYAPIDLYNLFNLAFSLRDRGMISRNLMYDYNQLALNESNEIDLSTFDVSKIILINTKPDDVILGIQDQERVFNKTILIADTNKISLNFTRNVYLGVFGAINSHHGAIASNSHTIEFVIEELS
ncbi:S8 family serine peptidase [Candidatus Woesearchaeota archaeon]|nr:S8 family serine peptidase [Candidatus Woesearchaeota archaeon]HIH38479.1 S8 family serine peptidase [Candidatus Woesearchaeota archaeon]HIH49781.1 S8 family serine peptidase [Candidatus Woesearchaeota archaeon]HIJ03492.1 S8 family serine peptidase [Candidatus Woesearchaeota archaeon]